MQRLRIVLYSMCTTLKYVLQRKIYQRSLVPCHFFLVIRKSWGGGLEGFFGGGGVLVVFGGGGVWVWGGWGGG